MLFTPSLVSSCDLCNADKMPRESTLDRNHCNVRKCQVGIREHKHPREVGTRDKLQEDEMKAQSLGSSAANGLAMAVYGTTS